MNLPILPLVIAGISAGFRLMALLCVVGAIAEAVVDYRKHKQLKDRQ